MRENYANNFHMLECAFDTLLAFIMPHGAGFTRAIEALLALLNDEAEWRREKKQKVLPTLLYRFGSLNDFHCVSLSPTRRRALYR
jgi:hypothetical protein